MGIIPSMETTKEIRMHSSDFDSFALLSEKENEYKKYVVFCNFSPRLCLLPSECGYKIPWPFSPTCYAESVSHHLEFSASLVEPDRYMEGRWREVRRR